MRDAAEKILLDEVKPMTVEGKTKIILTDTRTGKEKIIEHKNVFQSAVLAAQLRSFGACNNSPWGNSIWAGRPLWRNLCGGIFLFRDQIAAPAEYMPAGNLMVANGSYGVENNGIPTELGSYNSIESSTSGSGSLSFVYDWGTSQGNGTISCVCLTSELGGLIGYGNESGAARTPANILANQNSDSAGAKFYYSGRRYRCRNVDMTNKAVVIADATDGVTMASIFLGQNYKENTYTYTGDVIGNPNGNNIFIRILSGEEFAIVRANTSFDAIETPTGETASILVFNARTKTLRKQTIINTTGSTIAWIGGGTAQGINIMQDNNGNYYAAENTNNGKLWKFDAAGAYQGIVGNHAHAQAAHGILTPELLYTTPSIVNNENMWIIDGVNERITNGSLGNDMGLQLDHLEGIDAICYASSGASNLVPYKNPLYLATINNLETSVTKDSTQTMKVIYTLTEAS